MPFSKELRLSSRRQNSLRQAGSAKPAISHGEGRDSHEAKPPRNHPEFRRALLDFSWHIEMTAFARQTSRLWALTLFLALGFVFRIEAQPQERQGEPGQPVQQNKPANSQPDPSSSSADITAVPNRPTFASTAEMVPLRVFEIEYGLEAADGHQNINGLLKWGAVKNLELWFLNNPIERDAGIAGLGDSGAGFKYKLFAQQKVRPTLSFLYVATIPTARPQLGGGAMQHLAQILLSKDFGKHHFDANEGVQFVGRPGSTGFDRRYFTALSYAHPLTGKWAYTAEVAGFSRANLLNPATMTILAAPTYSWSSRLVLDGGVYFAVYGNLPRATFFLGVTYSVADLYHFHRARGTPAKAVTVPQPGSYIIRAEQRR